MSIVDFIWPVFFPLVAAIISAAHIYLKKYSGGTAMGNFLMWQLAVGFGLSLLWDGFGHLVFPNQVAESIGWPTGSPFQREVGMWDAAMGITGLLCLKFRDEFWIAMITGAGLFSIAAGLGHVWELVVQGDTAPNNAGAVMYMDIFFPVFLAALFLWYWKRKRDSTRSLAPSDP